MLTVIFSIITAYVGMCVSGLFGAGTDESIAIFALMGFLVPTVYRLEKIYDELVKGNNKE
nr:hypothetical protein [uncultured Niameybacter sp.]